MAASYLHLKEQKDVIATMGQSLLFSMAPFLKPGRSVPALPSPVHKAKIRARSNKLIDDYITHIGGSIDAHRKIIPWHFYPQWVTPIIGKTMENVPFSLTKILNAGCNVTINHQIPRDSELLIKGQLKEIVNDDRKILLVQQIITETKELKDALIIEQSTIIPKNLGPKKKSNAPKNQIPFNAEKIGTLNLNRRAGLDFALLTGDFNPIHWIPAYAKAMGFQSTINHGFSTMARAMELINFEVFEGEVDRLKTVSIRFTRPLRFPTKVDVFKIDQKFYVGHGPGGLAFLVGEYTTVEEK